MLPARRLPNVTNWTDFAIPLLTFVLGGLATLTCARRREQLIRTKRHIVEMSGDAIEWYKLLVDLQKILQAAGPDVEIERRAAVRVRDEQLYPRYVHALGALMKQRSCVRLVELGYQVQLHLFDYPVHDSHRAGPSVPPRDDRERSLADAAMLFDKLEEIASTMEKLHIEANRLLGSSWDAKRDC